MGKPFVYNGIQGTRVTNLHKSMISCSVIYFSATGKKTKTFLQDPPQISFNVMVTIFGDCGVF